MILVSGDALVLCKVANSIYEVLSKRLEDWQLCRTGRDSRLVK